MKTKQPVYNGYNEEWLTGSQLKEKFKNHYLTIGRHHADILDISIPDYLEIKQIQENTEYRVFLNSVFCRIMSADTDKELVFFGHHPVSTEESPREIEKICSLCGVPMQWK